MIHAFWSGEQNTKCMDLYGHALSSVPANTFWSWFYVVILVDLLFEHPAYDLGPFCSATVHQVGLSLGYKMVTDAMYMIHMAGLLVKKMCTRQ